MRAKAGQPDEQRDVQLDRRDRTGEDDPRRSDPDLVKVATRCSIPDVTCHSRVCEVILRQIRELNESAILAPPVVANMTREAYVLMVGFGLSIPVFFITTNAWLLWFALPVLVGQVRRLRRRNPRNSEAGQAPG